MEGRISREIASFPVETATVLTVRRILLFGVNAVKITLNEKG